MTLPDPEPQLQVGPPPMPSAGFAVRCPACGSTQFFGRRRMTKLGVLLYVSGLIVLFISLPLILAGGAGLCTIVFAPILCLTGWYACRRHVNTCANCKREF